MVYGVGTTHHVKIGDDYFIVRQGSYRKVAAPTFGARFATGDPDYNNLSFWQYWVQHCWVGGFGAETWTDDAMYDDGVGIDASEHEMMTLSRGLEPLTNRGTGNWTVGGTVAEREFVEFNGKLYCLVKATSPNSKLYRYNNATGDWSFVRTFAETTVSVAAWSGKLWFGNGGAELSYMNPDETFGGFAKPSGRTETPYAMFVFRDRMYVPFGRYIWRMKEDETWDGSTVFFDAIGVDTIVAMEAHLGFLYMGSTNGHILRSDGNATFDLWQWDPGTQVMGMRSYDGRLFVTAREYDYDTEAAQGVLYQFTGSAVTELKRWGINGRDTSARRLRVIFRKLMFGASNLLGNGKGFGVASYDALEDAYHIVAANQNTTSFAQGTNYVNYIVDDVAYWNGYIFLSVRGFGVFRTRLRVNDDGPRGGINPTRTYDTAGGFYTSSDFDGGTPGLMKLWREIRVQADLPSTGTSITVHYSTNGGKTWSLAGTMNKTSSTQVRYNTKFPLNNVRATRIKYKLTLNTNSLYASPKLLSVSVPYLPQPEPNWRWEMFLVMAEEKILLDGSEDTEDVDAVKGRLEAAFRNQEMVQFTDIDGTVWADDGPGVLIIDYGFDARFVGPDSDGDIEGDVRVVLMEAVDDYGL